MRRETFEKEYAASRLTAAQRQQVVASGVPDNVLDDVGRALVQQVQVLGSAASGIPAVAQAFGLAEAGVKLLAQFLRLF